MRVPSKSLRAFRRRYKLSSERVAEKMGLSATSLLRRELIEWGEDPRFEAEFVQACFDVHAEQRREMEKTAAGQREP